MLAITEDDIALSELLIDPRNNYIKILQAVQEDKTQNLHENIITYVDYFYAVDFIIEKYNIKNKNLLRDLRNIEFQKIETLKDIDKTLSKIEAGRFKQKAIDELNIICKEIFNTYRMMTRTNNPINIAHVVSSYTASTIALEEASEIIGMTSIPMLNTSLVKIVLSNKKCNSKMISNMYQGIKAKNIELPELIQHPKTPAEIVNDNAKSNSIRIRMLVAHSLKTSEENLFALGLDGDKLVRSVAYYNPKMSEEGKQAVVFAGGVFTQNEYEKFMETQYIYS